MAKALRQLWWACVLIAAAASAHGDGVALKTPRGASIEIIAEYPAGNGVFPAVVLAPGSSYDARKPLLATVARALVAQGFAVYRFNWAYAVADPEKGKPSADRIAEIEDFTAALNAARADARVDKSRIVIAGKSLGSIIVWRVLRAEPDIRAAILLTPVCSTQEAPTPVVNYADIRTETRPLLWLLGDRDPVCAPAGLYRHVADAGGIARIAVVAGNHSLVEGVDSSAQAQNERTIDLAGRLVADFAATALARASASH